MATHLVNNQSFFSGFALWVIFGQLLVIFAAEMFICQSCGREVEPRAAPSLCDGRRPEVNWRSLKDPMICPGLQLLRQPFAGDCGTSHH
jgi:hypothetical protein